MSDEERARRKAERDAARRSLRDARRKELRALSEMARATAEKARALSDAGGPVHKKVAKGQHPFIPTPEQRQQVQTLSGLGLRADEIAIATINPNTGRPIDEKTLRAHFEDELASGPVRAAAKVAESLYNKAIGKGPQSVTAAIWFSKCRMGWRERVVAEVQLMHGVLVPPAQTSPADWLAAAAAANLARREPGTGDDG